MKLLKLKINHKTLIGFTVGLTLVSLLAANILPLARKESNAAASFLANWNAGSLDAFVGNGSTTASTDSILPDLVDGGFGGTGQAIQASRGDTLKYATANNLDNNKVEYSMQMKNKYALTGTDLSSKRTGPFNIFGITYDDADNVFYLADRGRNGVIKMNWDGTVWETSLAGMFSSIGKLDYDQNSGYFYIVDGTASVIKTKFDGTGWKRLNGFAGASGIVYDPISDYIYVSGNNKITRTKIDGTGWETFGTGGAGINQFNNPVDVDYHDGYLYVSDSNNKRIVKTQFDGSGWTALSTASWTSSFNAGQYDPVSDFIYVSGGSGGGILKTKIDGSGWATSGNGNCCSYYPDFYYLGSSDYIFMFNGGNSSNDNYEWRYGWIDRWHPDGSGKEGKNYARGLSDSGIKIPLSVWENNGIVYALSTSNYVVAISEDNRDFNVIGSGGSGEQRFVTYGGLFFDDGNLLVGDGGNRQIVETNMSQSVWNVQGSWAPSDVSYDSSQDYIYSTDNGYNGIRRGKTGQYPALWGSGGSGIGQFSGSRGVWIDPASQFLFVGDTGNGRIIKTQYNDTTNWVTLGGFNSPSGIQYEPSSEYIYVADTGNNRIVKTKIDGSGWTVLGGFAGPRDVYYDAATDYIYVADTNNNRIVKTKMDGSGWTNMTLDPRRVLFKTQGDEMRLELDLYSQRLKFWMKKATGGIYLQSEPLNWGIDEWHKPSVYFNRATGRVELKIDGVVVDSAEDPTWTTSLPSFGSYVYVSTDPANPDAANVSPIDDFKVDIETVDVTDPINPVTIRGYDSSEKATEYLPDTWGNAANPYFEFSGATDDLSGVLGYWVYFGSEADGDPITEGVYQAHAGPPDAVQTFTSSASLPSGTTYYLRVRTRDNDYNYSEPSTLFTYKYDGGPPNPPEYINSSPQGCSTSSTFTYSWPKVPEEVSGLAGYEYRKGSTGSIQMVPGLNLSDDTYSFETTPYQEGDNVFYLRAKDNAGNVSNWQTAVTCSTGITYIIDGPAIVTGPSSMTVTWTSSKKTTGFIEVRDANSYREPQGHRDFEMSHKITVTGLKSDREYEYRIVWEDESKNDGETEWFKTTTQALPQITDLKAEVISPTRAIISWSTNYPSSATLEWGVTSSGQKVILPGSATSFSYQLDNLVGNTTYLISANCTTSDGADYTAGSTFQTPPLPIISGIRFDPVTDQSAAGMRITWVTNIETTSTVFFGPKGATKLELSASERVKEHQIIIPNLQDNTDYEMYASGTDQWGNITTSEINLFKTALDTRPAKISAITIESSNVGLDKQDKAQIAVSWKSDEAATSMVEFGEGISGAEYSNKTTEDDAFTTNHLVIIPDLTPSKPYHIRVIVTDKGGNVTKSEDHTVIPGDVPRSALQIILQTFTRLFGWLGL